MKELTAKQLRNEVVNKLWTYGNLPKNIQEFMGDEVAFMLEIIDTKVKEQLTLTDVVNCNHDFQRVERGGEFEGNQCHCGEWEDLT